jgi:hypothetical protein
MSPDWDSTSCPTISRQTSEAGDARVADAFQRSQFRENLIFLMGGENVRAEGPHPAARFAGGCPLPIRGLCTISAFCQKGRNLPKNPRKRCETGPKSSLRNIRRTLIRIRVGYAADSDLLTFAKLEFVVNRMDDPKSGVPPSGKATTAARLVLPIPGILDLHGKLTQLIGALQAQGILKQVHVPPMPTGKLN